MSTLTVNHANGSTSVVRNVDSTRVVDGVLQARRAQYNGGIQITVKAFPLANINSFSTDES